MGGGVVEIKQRTGLWREVKGSEARNTFVVATANEQSRKDEAASSRSSWGQNATTATSGDHRSVYASALFEPNAQRGEIEGRGAMCAEQEVAGTWGRATLAASC